MDSLTLEYTQTHKISPDGHTIDVEAKSMTLLTEPWNERVGTAFTSHRQLN